MDGWDSGKVWTYMGCNISRSLPSGMYGAYSPNGTWVRADTLDGIKRMIKDYR